MREIKNREGQGKVFEPGWKSVVKDKGSLKKPLKSFSFGWYIPLTVSCGTTKTFLEGRGSLFFA